MQTVADSVVEGTVDVRVKCVHRATEKSCGVVFGCAVRMNLYENPFRSACDGNTRIYPGGKTVEGREMRIRGVDRAVFKAGEHLPDPTAHIKRQRSLNDQKSVRRCLRANPDCNTVLVRPRFHGIVNCVIDAVYRSRLRWVWRGGVCEVGIASSFEQHADLVVHAAPSSVRPGIVERPITVDEAKRNAAVWSPAQQTVAMKQRLGKYAKAIA